MSNDLISRRHFGERVRRVVNADKELSADYLNGVDMVLYLLLTEPAVPQEMSAREFLVAYKRMCASFPETDCSKCPIYTPYKDCTDNPCDWDIDKILPAVEKWAREHSERSEEDA